MDKFIMTGGNKLKGTVTIGGSKNATLALMSATLLASGKYRFENTPEAPGCRDDEQASSEHGC